MLNKKALAASVSAPPAEYVEDVFSTYLYTGTGSSQTITNNIDLSGEGGMVWIKSRSAATNNFVFDTNRGTTDELNTNTTDAEASLANSLTAFNSNGFTVGSASGIGVNEATYCSWTFRKAPKFFDVVTYTGNGSNRTISHNLGSVPGMIIVKRLENASSWQVYHRSLANTEYLVLNTTAAKATGSTRWNSTTPTSTVFSIGTDATVNQDSETYVAYLFAHNAGGFGDAGTDNIITCGSFTANGSGGLSDINLGYEPQWILYKNTATDAWRIGDVMRGWSQTEWKYLASSDAGAESDLSNNPSYFSPNATGFGTPTAGLFTAGETYIYMAIRRPMKTPTSGTSVFDTSLNNSSAVGTSITIGFPFDMQIQKIRSTYASNTINYDRLRGLNSTTSQTTKSPTLFMNGTDAEDTVNYTSSLYVTNTGFQVPNDQGPYENVFWSFRRATGFFDVVCYTGTGTTQTLTHNLGVVPELVIVKQRNGTGNWWTWAKPVTSPVSNWWINYSRINGTNAFQDWGDTSGIYSAPTSTTLTYGGYSETNGSGNTFVTYLFASVAGVSKVGSYTGNGSNQTINCGFTAGARFVLIKRTDSTGDWCVFDTARGIVSGNDPFLQLNTTATQVTGEDAVDPTNSGFIVNETTEALNTNNATYIYLAIA